MDQKRGIMSVSELRRVLAPIAERYGVERIILFGSVARGDCDEGSDYDFCIDRGEVNGLAYGRLYMDIMCAVGREMDMVTTASIQSDPEFLENVRRDGVAIYERGSPSPERRG